LTVRNGEIVELDFLADPERLRLLHLTILEEETTEEETSASERHASSSEAVVA
jgi:hypothetical protein